MFPRPRGRRGPGALGVACLAAQLACALGPDYRRPALDLPARHRDGPTWQAGSQGLADVPWWSLFADPTLQQLVAAALAENQDLRQAAARVMEAGASAQAVASNLWPHLELDAQGQQRRGLLTSPSSLPPTAVSFFTGSAQASWELDLWGRLRRAREAGLAELLAASEVRRGVAIGLVAEVATAYFNLRQLDQQRDIALTTLATYARTRDLYAARLTGGTANRVPLATGNAQVADARALAIDLSRQVVAQENALCRLLGRFPGPVLRDRPPVALTLPPGVPADLPSALLERRPDVRRAEADLIAANAQIGAAKANFFPQISLTAVGGAASTALARLTTGPASVWALGGVGSWLAPLLQGARLRHLSRAAHHHFDAALATYEGTVVAALGEVATALNDVQALAQVARARERQVDDLAEALALAVDRYRGGVTSFLEVTTTQNQLLPARLQLVATRTRAQLAVVTLYRALGGGWQAPEAPGAAPKTSGVAGAAGARATSTTH